MPMAVAKAGWRGICCTLAESTSILCLLTTEAVCVMIYNVYLYAYTRAGAHALARDVMEGI